MSIDEKDNDSQLTEKPEEEEEEEDGEEYESEDTVKKLITIGEFFGIKYYLKHYKINLIPAIEHFMSQTYDKGYNQSLYSRKDNRVIKNLIDLIIYSNPKPIQELLNSDENMKKKKKRRNQRIYLKTSLLEYLK